MYHHWSFVHHHHQHPHHHHHHSHQNSPTSAAGPVTSALPTPTLYRVIFCGWRQWSMNEHRSKRGPIALFCFETNFRLGWSCHSCHSFSTVIKMKASQWSETDADEKLRLTEKRFWRSYQTDRGSPVTSNAAFGKIWCLIRIITKKEGRMDVTRDTSVSSLY